MRFFLVSTQINPYSIFSGCLMPCVLHSGRISLPTPFTPWAKLHQSLSASASEQHSSVLYSTLSKREECWRASPHEQGHKVPLLLYSITLLVAVSVSLLRDFLLEFPGLPLGLSIIHTHSVHTQKKLGMNGRPPRSYPIQPLQSGMNKPHTHFTTHDKKPLNK